MRTSDQPEIFTETAVLETEQLEGSDSVTYALLERLEKAEARIADLERVNEAFRLGTARIATSASIDVTLDSFLVEAVQITGALCGAIASRIAGTEFTLRSLARDGAGTVSDISACEERFREVSRRDPNGIMTRIVAGEVFSASVDQLDGWYPEAAAPYQAPCDNVIWHFPFYTSGEVSGFLALAFPYNCSLCDWKNSTVQALSQQASLALNVVLIAEAAKTCAIASERAKTAQSLAGELARINTALRHATDQLATQTELGSFYGNLLQEAALLLGADSAHLTIVDETAGMMRKVAYLKYGVLEIPDNRIETSLSDARTALDRLCQTAGIHYFDLTSDEEIFWPGAIAFHRDAGHKTVAAIPLMRSDHCIGFIVFGFVDVRVLTSQEEELLKTLSQQATLALHLTRLADQVRRGAILEERVALARELHDTLLQGFTGIALQIRALLKTPQQDSHKIHKVLEEIEAEATRSVREARRAVGDMRGNEPGTADLVTALQGLVQSESMRTKAPLCWKLEGEPRELPGPVAESLFRIGREALSNAIRHAHADCIEVALFLSARAVHLKVQDNGRGFSMTPEMARQQGHWGLVGMQERVERLNGQCRITSELGRGTTVSVEISL